MNKRLNRLAMETGLTKIKNLSSVDKFKLIDKILKVADDWSEDKLTNCDEDNTPSADSLLQDFDEYLYDNDEKVEDICSFVIDDINIEDETDDICDYLQTIYSDRVYELFDEKIDDYKEMIEDYKGSSPYGPGMHMRDFI